MLTVAVLVSVLPLRSMHERVEKVCEVIVRAPISSNDVQIEGGCHVEAAQFAHHRACAGAYR